MRADLLVFLAKSKGHKMLTSICENGQFILTCENNVELTNSDFTEQEIEKLKKDHQDKLQDELNNIMAKRQAALDKLEALGLDEDDLKALGF